MLRVGGDIEHGMGYLLNILPPNFSSPLFCTTGWGGLDSCNYCASSEIWMGNTDNEFSFELKLNFYPPETCDIVKSG